MDLVDIDQVLDNLEEREAADESSRGYAVSPHHQHQRLRSTQTSVVSSNGTTWTGARTTVPATIAGAAVAREPDGAVKSFVGVSHVFNSLDDYEKNVESLGAATARQQYDEECRPIGGTTLCPPFVGNSAETMPDVRPHTYRRVENGNDNETKSTMNENDDDEVMTGATESVSSNTSSGVSNTSNNSNSIFSTSQSAGVVSTTEETSAAAMVTRGVGARSARSVAGEESNDHEEHCGLLGSAQPLDYADTDALPAGNRSPILTGEEEEDAAEELATVGLSSLSLVTSLNSHVAMPYSEATSDVSSALRNVLENLTETNTTSSPVSQVREGPGGCVATNGVDAPNLRDSPSPVEASGRAGGFEKEQIHREENRRYVNLEENSESAEPAQAPTKLPPERKLERTAPPSHHRSKPHAHQHKPITFGSTMDEISDTELDSMLQEMDIDEEAGVADGEQSEEGARSVTAVPIVKSNDEAGAMAHSSGIMVTATVTSEKCEANREEDELASSSGRAAADNSNADNFSQASTVEFSELKVAATQLENKFADDDEELHETTSRNSLDSSYSDSDTSLESDAAPCDGEITHEDSTAPVEDENEGGSALPASSVRPQRPTTLDLQNLKSRQLVNAGQTPSGAETTEEESGAGGVSIADDEPIADSQEEGSLQAQSTGENYNVAHSSYDPHEDLGKIPPIWVPDHMATVCMQCHTKFTMIKRRHHCRACGKVLCSLCCSQKFKLEFLEAQPDARVCVECFLILTQRQQLQQGTAVLIDPAVLGPDIAGADVATGGLVTTIEASAAIQRSPNPNNPMEYCSMIPPHRQVSNTPGAPPPSVIVPVGVLKKDGGGSHSSNSSNSGSVTGTARKRKSVMFSDGIAPGSELADMENQWSEPRHSRRSHQQHGDGGAGSGPEKVRNASASQKPSTPAKAAPSSGSNSNDLTTMGLMASLFRGSIPPIAAAATVSAVECAGSGGGVSGAKAKSRDVSDSAAGSSSSPRQKSQIGAAAEQKAEAVRREKRLPPSGCDEHGCFIPTGEETSDQLPPIYVRNGETGCDYEYKNVINNGTLIERLQRETLKFALQRNLFVHVKIVNLKCCMNRTVINFTTSGMHHVGNDEVIILLEHQSTPAAIRDDSSADIDSTATPAPAPALPKDIFVHLYEIYRDAESGQPMGELSYSSPRQSSFLGSREYGGFIFIRATYQCLQDVIVPESPFLIGILIHRSEVPWAKVFPLRLMLRLGAQYRYYPCPHISIRNRESVYAEIAQTIINFLADFRNYSYTLPCIHGMYIHMEDRQTTVLIPRNRLAEISKAIDNSSDHILAFGGNFSKEADGHLVCMQNMNDVQSEMYAYSTQAINIQGQPRKVTGASFIVLNEALKTTSGLSGKCSIVEDGLMVQILPSKMEEVRSALRNQKDIDIVCGPLNAEEPQTEMVTIKWVDSDTSMNVGVKSPIDDQSMEGVASIRMHATYNYANANYAIRLTDIYILKLEAWYATSDSGESNVAANVTRIAEQLARSVSVALLPFLDLLVASGSYKLALRATLHQDNVCYEAGAKGSKLPPLYMNALDNQLIPTLHNESNGIEGEPIVLELIFYILNV